MARYANLGYNELTGSIPSEIGRWTGMTYYFSLGGNGGITGSIPSELGQLTAFTEYLTFESNALSGSIPSELGTMHDGDDQ